MAPTPSTHSGSGASELPKMMRSLAPALLLALVLAGGGAPLGGQIPPAAAVPTETAATETPAAEAPAVGPTVTGVEVRSDAPLDPALDLETLVETEVGEPLTDEGIRHTLRNLQASGTAAETELYTRDDPAGGGVVV